jgi:peptidoglycan hydrolase-like protein with peptidoglycan-binding domain
MNNRVSLAVALSVLLAGAAPADELTLMVEQDLERLGYGPGTVDGEETIDTTIAITKFQAENNLEITGEVTPDLARALMSAQPAGTAATTATASATAAATPEPDPAALQAAQQACLQQKVAEAQAAQQKKRGFGRLLSAVTREATRAGNYDLARTTSDIYSASATADDLSAAAKDLGLTEDDIAACQNPPM